MNLCNGFNKMLHDYNKQGNKAMFTEFTNQLARMYKKWFASYFGILMKMQRPLLGNVKPKMQGRI